MVIEQTQTTIEEESVGSNPGVIRTTKTVQEPLVKSGPPQKVYEKKKNILRSWDVIWFVLIIIEVILIFRMVFKAIGANPYSGFVSLIYAISDPLTVLFTGIIRPTVLGNSVIEWSIIIAGIVYALIAWGLIYLLNLARPISPEEAEQSV